MTLGTHDIQSWLADGRGIGKASKGAKPGSPALQFRDRKIAMKKIFLTTCFVVLTCSTAHAARWIPLGDSGDQRVAFDVETIVFDADGFSVWVRSVYGNAATAPRLRDVPMGNVTTKWWIKCDAHAVAMGPAIFYDRAERRIDGFAGAPNDFTPMARDSGPDIVRDVFCKQGDDGY